YLDRKLIVILAMGFASGLPFLLTSVTLSAWLAEAGVTRTLIGFMSWASSVYALKFLWSPVMDRLPVPWLTARVGRRRAWMLVSQALCAAAMVGLGLTDPAANLAVTAAWCVALAFASATQDIVIDAYRIEYLAEAQQGAGAAMTTMGYRIGILASGGGALIIADAAGWQVAYAAMAVLMLIGVITTCVSPEPRTDAAPPAASYAQWIKGAVVDPFADFLTRPNAIAILAFIGLYKYGDALLAVMANPFYVDLGFSLTEIGVVTKTYGVALTMIGSFAGGMLVMRYGILPTLFWGGIAMAGSNLLFALLAKVGASLPLFVAVISVDNFANGLGGVAAIAYLSSLCNVAFTATQYALMTSFMAFTRTILASGGGWLADQVDWASYFVITTFAGVPGLFILWWLMRHIRTAAKPAAPVSVLAADD
ncbi:MAG: AmpG family muropeptide MFS transporter, partial [Rhodospirillaceae bacterium]|nr:AmpG family muropeptide MFS transporter [Rhodospirillaceae bacterium]